MWTNVVVVCFWGEEGQLFGGFSDDINFYHKFIFYNTYKVTTMQNSFNNSSNK